MNKPICILGNGSFATALAKVLTDNGKEINWWMRNQSALEYIASRHHNPHYLSSIEFNIEQLHLFSDINLAISESDIVLIAVPSAFSKSVISQIDAQLLKQKIVVSAIKGIVPDENMLLNEYLAEHLQCSVENYVCITGPCHAEEIANEKLSYLTFSSINEVLAKQLAAFFENDYLKTVISSDVYGVQFAGILKNIYALGAGIAHGLDYGDNFLSVYITNTFAEMKQFMKDVASYNDHLNTPHHYITSAYLGDLLVTCYSLHSRNRRFGNLIGKGYSVQATQTEMNMVAEGYYATKCIYEINQKVKSNTPIINYIYSILWQQHNPAAVFANIEKILN